MSAASRTKKSIFNMASSMAYSIMTLVFRFVIRRIFIEAFGIEVLGYNSTFNSILGMLNLAELGIGVAITYKLYEPVAQKDYAVMHSYIHIFKKMYTRIGWIIMVMGIIIVPFLPYVVKKDYSSLAFLCIIFILQMLSTVATYWFAYKRIVFTIYQDSYLCNIVDTIFFVVFNILQIIDIIFWKNYYVFLIINIFQILFSNIVLSIWNDKRYPELVKAKNQPFKKMTLKDLQHDIGNVVISKLGGYVLNSTDALVVSTIMGATMTGYMTNYTTVYTSFQTAVLTMLTSIQPSLGNKIYSDNDKKSVETTVLNITFLCQIIGCVFSVVAYFLIDSFIMLWLSEDFVLDHLTAAFFSINVYIYIIMYPISLLFGALGFFMYDKIAIIFAAVINIIVSVLLVYKFGILGVLVGTNIALLIYWGGRTYLIYTRYYYFSPVSYIKIILRSIAATVISVIIITLIQCAIGKRLSAGISSFITRGVFYTIMVFLINLVFFYKTKQFCYMQNLIRNILKVRRHGRK